jgi:hypothetical protein
MTNRWSIAVAGVLLQVALGAVYAWSVFRAPSLRAEHVGPDDSVRRWHNLASGPESLAASQLHDRK